MRTTARRRLSLLTATAALVAGCGGTDVPEPRPAAPAADGGGALGGGARTTTLARADDIRVPGGELAWVAHEVVLEPGQELRHEHAFATTVAREGGHRIASVDGRVTMAPGEGAATRAGTPHVHAAIGGESVFWEVVLAEPGTRLPGARDARRVFTSEPLEGIPASPSLQFIRVDLAPGAETSVHTHPGPEFIFGTSGRFTYENGIEGERPFGPGDAAGIPPDTAVQKRNHTNREASFLSWFLVDPDKPFAPGAAF